MASVVQIFCVFLSTACLFGSFVVSSGMRFITIPCAACISLSLFFALVALIPQETK